MHTFTQPPSHSHSYVHLFFTFFSLPPCLSSSFISIYVIPSCLSAHLHSHCKIFSSMFALVFFFLSPALSLSLFPPHFVSLGLIFFQPARAPAAPHWHCLLLCVCVILSWSDPSCRLPCPPCQGAASGIRLLTPVGHVCVIFFQINASEGATCCCLTGWNIISRQLIMNLWAQSQTTCQSCLSLPSAIKKNNICICLTWQIKAYWNENDLK